MNNLTSKVNEIYTLEQFSSRDTLIHNLHPMVKIIATFFYIVCIVSFDRYAFTRMVPYIFYPVIIMALADIPYSMILRRLLLALPFTLFAGISNIFFDRAIAFNLGSIAVSFGVHLGIPSAPLRRGHPDSCGDDALHVVDGSDAAHEDPRDVHRALRNDLSLYRIVAGGNHHHDHGVSPA
jgi:hypothetical protein